VQLQPESFLYPLYGTPLVEAYDRRFEAVFILLHPFIAVPLHLAWSVTKHYPTDAEIIANGSRYSWESVCRHTALFSCARLNKALLTATGSLTGDLADPAGRNALQSFLQSHPIWMPSQGRFEPLLQNDLLRIFTAAGCDELIAVPEFPSVDPVTRLPISSLQARSIPFPMGGTLLAPDASLLLTVDWDSFFTLLCGPRNFLAQIAANLKLEGFFATANTDHAWFNYSMGCATVTLSPEHWQTARSSP